MLPHLIPLLQWLDQKLETAIANLDDAEKTVNPYHDLLQITPETAAKIVGKPLDQSSFVTEDNPNLAIAVIADTPLHWLQKTYQLDDIEIQIMAIALAVELDRNYEKLYAYLQDDVRAKRPTVDLALNLICGNISEKLTHRRYFQPDSTLTRDRLLRLVSPVDHSSLLAQELHLDPQIIQYLLEIPGLDAQFKDYALMIEPQTQFTALKSPPGLLQLIQDHWQATKPLKLYFQGGNSLEKQTLVQSLANQIKAPLLIVDLPKMMAAKVNQETALFLLLRQAQLQQTWLYLANIDPLFQNTENIAFQGLCRALGDYPSLVILSGEMPFPSSPYPLGLLTIPFTMPDFEQRRNCWLSHLKPLGIMLNPAELDSLSDHFRLYPHQIRNAVAMASQQMLWEGYQNKESQGKEKPKSSYLFAAARAESGYALITLARKIEPKYGWEDIILQSNPAHQLRELCNQAKQHHFVMENWQFGERLSLGKGLNALFSGAPGTGKTMAAEVIAQDLQLDLYKIDLSQIVSKYIGDTEKNLSQVFDAATNSNAILLFDEADALFGKRSEVKDARDRYANMETSYLLQKMEEYAGIAILTTNFRHNLDEAFTRRLRFIIEFSLPTQEERRRMWELMLPMNTAICQDLDLDFLAGRFELTGADIRNIALRAAFLAAGDENQENKAIAMNHIIKAIRLEYQKQNKILMTGDLGDYT
ncbi:MAG: ATP-binding protein [Dolichospermum sp.]